MKARDLYKDLTKELDKYGSPTFTVGDFNYFSNSGVSEYINENYRKFDILQKEDDDLRFLITRGNNLTIPSTGEIGLPSTYRHLLYLSIRVRFLVNKGKYKINDVIEFYPERMKSGQKGARQRNAFGKPSYNRYYYEISGSTLKIYFDSTSVEFTGSNNAKIDFVIEPAQIYLNPLSSSDYNLEINNNTLVFSPTTRNHVYFEVVKKIRDIFLENIESPRIGTATQQSLARQE